MENSEYRRGVIRPVECVKEGWELIKGEYWLLFAITLVGGIIGGATLHLLLGSMICGITYCYLKKIDGGRVEFDGLWKGFQWLLPGFVVMLVIVVPMIVVYAIIYFPILMAVIMGPKLDQEEFMMMLLGAVFFDVIFIIIMVCLHTLLMFAFPLIVDRGLGAGPAMMTSAKAVFGNLGGVAGLLGVNTVLAIVGQLALCVGIYFVIPVMLAGQLVAYRKIFPARAADNYTPPYTY